MSEYEEVTGYCAIGAMKQAMEELKLADRIMVPAGDALLKQAGSEYCSIPEWNDEHARNKYEVIDAMRMAAKDLRNKAKPEVGTD